MPPPSLLSGRTWSDLPPNLQSHVISYLSNDRRRCSLKITLASAAVQSTPLPHQLLPVAKASSLLSATVADVLGSRAVYLTSNVAKKELAEWVSALGPFVKAVSTWDTYGEDGEEEDQQDLDKLCDNSLALFKALSAKEINLQVLDVTDVPFAKCEEKKIRMFSGLVSALEQSKASLKELALPVCELCAEALDRVSLEKLNVCELELQELDGSRDILRATIGRSGEAFMQMLRSLDGHASKSKKVSTLTELRLIHVHEAPCIDIEESGCASLFYSVRTLRLDTMLCSNLGHSVALFISVFPNLECVDWNGAVHWKHLDMINRACPKLRELHLRAPLGFSRVYPHVSDPDDLSLEYTLRASQGRMKTIVLHNRLSTEQIKMIGERCPALEHLMIWVREENVVGLSTLLASHCRQIRRLELCTIPFHPDSLGEKWWDTLTRAVCSASDELNDLTIGTSVLCSRLEDRIKPIIQSMVNIVEFLGDRARKVSFQIDAYEPEYDVLLDAKCRLLRTCATHTKYLECLEVIFMGQIPSTAASEVEIETKLALRLVKEKDNLLSQARQLQSIDLGPLYGLLAEKLKEFEG